MQNRLPFAILRRVYECSGFCYHLLSVHIIDRLRPLDDLQYCSNWYRALAIVLAEERQHGRTAEDERRDVLAHLRFVTNNYLRIHEEHAERGNAKASERFEEKADCLELCHIDIRNGAHVGASTR